MWCVMKEFVEYIVKNLVDEPNAVNVECSEDNEGLLMEMRVAKEDIGKVVGREGKTIRALRKICMQVAHRIGRRVRVVLVED